MLIPLPFSPGYFINIDHIVVIEPTSEITGNKCRLLLTAGVEYFFPETAERLAAHIAEAVWHKCNPTLNRKGPA